MGLLSIWDIGISLRADISSNLLYSCRKMSLYLYSSILYIVVLCFFFNIKLSHVGKCLRSGAGCSPDRNRCVLSTLHSCVLSIGFCRQFSCGFNVYRFLSWTVGKRCKSLLSPKSFLLLPNLLQLRFFVFVCSRMDFGLKTSERMFSDVVQFQLNTSVYSQFTALQRAYVNIAGFLTKLTGVF